VIPGGRRPLCEEHGKVIFVSFREADRTMKRLRRDFMKQTMPQRAYRDPECGNIHVTSKPRRSRKELKEAENASTSRRGSRARARRTRTRTPG